MYFYSNSNLVLKFFFLMFHIINHFGVQLYFFIILHIWISLKHVGISNLHKYLQFKIQIRVKEMSGRYSYSLLYVAIEWLSSHFRNVLFKVLFVQLVLNCVYISIFRKSTSQVDHNTSSLEMHSRVGIQAQRCYFISTHIHLSDILYEIFIFLVRVSIIFQYFSQQLAMVSFY